MKKLLFIIPLTFFFTLFYLTPAFAAVPSDYLNDFNNHFYGRIKNGDNYNWILILTNGTINFSCDSNGFSGTISSGSDWWEYLNKSTPDCPSPSDSNWVHREWTNVRDFSSGTVFDNIIAIGDVNINTSTIPVFDSIYEYEESITNQPPPEPEPGSNWLDDMWEWFLWQLGLNDDYSGDIDVWITGGDRERIEYVTPTPSPVPPSPTPYDLTVIDPGTGQPVYVITGIPGSTTIINGGDTYNGSDFDIFAVDLQIGDGGTSNPKDGLNSVMESSYDYLSDIDISPVSNSFSIIPSDWFLFIGVLGALPFIAGFIMRLLK